MDDGKQISIRLEQHTLTETVYWKTIHPCYSTLMTKKFDPKTDITIIITGYIFKKSKYLLPAHFICIHECSNGCTL